MSSTTSWLLVNREEFKAIKGLQNHLAESQHDSDLFLLRETCQYLKVSVFAKDSRTCMFASAKSLKKHTTRIRTSGKVDIYAANTLNSTFFSFHI